MDVIFKLSDEHLDAIAERVVVIQDKKKSEKKPPPEEETQYTVNEVAALSKREPQTIRKHIRLGLIAAAKTGKSWLISETNYNKYIKNEQ